MTIVAVDVSYCIVNTDGRKHLGACLGAVEAHHEGGLEAEVLVLDNASADGSVAEVERLAGASEWLGKRLRLIALDQRQGKAANDTRLLQEANGELCLLLNEDSELCAGAFSALAGAMRDDPAAGAAGAQLLDPAGERQPCAWRLPGIGTALAQALLLHRLLVTQSGGDRTRRVGWAQSAALMVRRVAAERVGWLDPAFFVYSDETDLCKRLADAGFHTLYVPAARAIHHEQLANDRSAGERRVVEFHRNRDLYVRKHHGRAQAAMVRALTALSYLPRVVAAAVLPNHDPAWFWLHARKAWRPSGEGLRELVDYHSAALDTHGDLRSEVEADRDRWR
ncbi:MAG: glycosyltransferase family 2 protein [Solirubrobacterales bacterium]